jgi:protein MAK16
LAKVEEQLAPLTQLKSECDRKAASHSERWVWAGFAGLMTQWLVLGRATWWEYSWDVIEPITWFVNMGNTITAYAFFLLYRRDFTYEQFKSLTASTRQIKLYKKVKLDTDTYSKLVSSQERLKAEIETIRSDYR